MTNLFSRKALIVGMFTLLLLPVGSFGASLSSATPILPPSADVELTIGSGNAVANGNVAIPVSINPRHDVASYNMQIDFDPAAVEVGVITPRHGSTDEATCSESESGCFQAHVDNEAGWIRVAWIDSSTGSASEHPISTAQALFDIQVKAKGAGSRTFSIDASDPEKLTFTDAEFNGPEPHRLSVEVKEGVLVVSNPPIQADADDVIVYIDGQLQQKTATAKTERVNGLNVTTIKVDNDKVIEQLKKQAFNKLLLPVSGSRSDVVVGELNGKLVKALEGKGAVLEISTDRGTYTLPASRIQIDDVSAVLGKNVPLEDIVIRIRIAKATDREQGMAEAAASSSGAMLVSLPIDFEISASYGGSTVSVNQFNDYVERRIALPDGVDRSRITTGVVLNADGTFSHVPTALKRIDGRDFAVINSMTNSTYQLIYNSTTFDDVEHHWSRADVDDLASRLIVNGVSERSFAPDRPVTRAEFVSIVLRTLGLHEPKEKAAAEFSDIAASNWFRTDALTAVSYRLVSGYEDGTFKPTRTITRAEAMVLIARAMRIAHLEVISNQTEATKQLKGYSDQAAIGSWAREAAASSVRQGIIKGIDGRLKPETLVTRAQTAAMVHRLLVQSALIDG